MRGDRVRLAEEAIASIIQSLVLCDLAYTGWCEAEGPEAAAAARIHPRTRVRMLGMRVPWSGNCRIDRRRDEYSGRSRRGRVVESGGMDRRRSEEGQ